MSFTVTLKPFQGREYLGQKNHNGVVGTKIGEEEGEGIERYEGCMAFVFLVVVWNRRGEHEGCHHEESHELNGKTTDVIYGEYHETSA